MSPEDAAEFNRLSVVEVEQMNWYLRKAFDYIKTHPFETLRGAFVKILAALSWNLNPAQGRFEQAVYFLSYFPILVLGLCGAYWSRREWRRHSLIYLLFAAFILVTAIFFGHTSHRSFLDLYLIVFAASAMSHIYLTVKQRCWTR